MKKIIQIYVNSNNDTIIKNILKYSLQIENTDFQGVNNVKYLGGKYLISTWKFR